MACSIFTNAHAQSLICMQFLLGYQIGSLSIKIYLLAKFHFIEIFYGEDVRSERTEFYVYMQIRYPRTQAYMHLRVRLVLNKIGRKGGG